uniref:Phage transcriptional regulator n=1 Tax=Arsenophonus nasoniae TaxID=638 RepID=D2TWZ7_9GAMM|nr:conserved hypothetical protein [Arsenophonus nasoniae]
MYIKDMGVFEFDKGKILPPRIKDKRHFNIMNEINKEVLILQTEIG